MLDPSPPHLRQVLTQVPTVGLNSTVSQKVLGLRGGPQAPVSSLLCPGRAGTLFSWASSRPGLALTVNSSNHSTVVGLNMAEL